MIEARRIADVMGGPQVLGHSVDSIVQLSEAVERGLPKSALRKIVQHIASDAGSQRRIMYRIVPEATYKRRRERLNLTESERTERLARVVATAEYVWDEAHDARLFLARPHPLLGGKAPLDAAMTELGARQVEEILSNILYGIAA